MKILSCVKWGTVVCCVWLVGCVPMRVWKSEPTSASTTNQYFTAVLSPICTVQGWETAEGCRAFTLKIINKTEKDIQISWDKTLFINGGQTAGGFMFEGVIYKDRNNPKPNDIVFANNTLQKTIWPNNLVEFGGRYGWFHQRISEGQKGAYLTVIVDGKEITERLLVTLSAQQVQ